MKFILYGLRGTNLSQYTDCRITTQILSPCLLYWETSQWDFMVFHTHIALVVCFCKTDTSVDTFFERANLGVPPTVLFMKLLDDDLAR